MSALHKPNLPWQEPTPPPSSGFVRPVPSLLQLRHIKLTPSSYPVREAAELFSQPSPDIHARPLSDTDLFEWHFTLRGPPSPSPYSCGIYHGRISLPAQYPLRPPSFRFLTPSGRFEVNREICLSISGHHEETWQPAWGIRTALVAIRAFMEMPVEGQVGGLECNDEGRRDLARRSIGWRCRECATAEGATAEGKTNEEVLDEERRRWLEMGGDTGAAGTGTMAEAEQVPPELRVGYRDELKTVTARETTAQVASPGPLIGAAQAPTASSRPIQPAPIQPAPPHITHTAVQNIPLPPGQGPSLRQRAPATNLPPPQQRNRLNHYHHRHHHHLQQQRRNPPSLNIDRLICFLLFLIAALLWRKLGKMEMDLLYVAGI